MQRSDPAKRIIRFRIRINTDNTPMERMSSGLSYIPDYSGFLP